MGGDVGPWRIRLLVTHIALGAGVALGVSLLLVAVAWHVGDRRDRAFRAAAEEAVDDVPPPLVTPRQAP
jgi:hypothetical protein